MDYKTPDAGAYDANNLLPFGRQLVAASNQARANGRLPNEHGLTFRPICTGANTSHILTVLWSATGRGNKNQAEDTASCFPYFWTDNRQAIDNVTPNPTGMEKTVNKKYDEHRRDPAKGGAANDCVRVLVNAVRGNKEVSGISIRVPVPPGATTKDRAV
jgi:hypothetical protein